MYNRLLKNKWDLEELKTGKAIEEKTPETTTPP